MARKRDYAKEYARRIARGKARGLSGEVARGHIKEGRAGITAARFLGIRPGDPLRAINLDDFEHWKKLRRIVAKDARETFGERPKRRKDEDEGEYGLRIQESFVTEKETRLAWDDRDTFIEQLKAAGATERQAYTFWFSP